jgi:ribosomal protein L11 methyltransferase
MAGEARYPYVAVDVGEADAEEAGACLFELGALGVEQRDASTLVRGAGGRVTLAASFVTRADADAALAQLPANWSPRIEEVVGDAWRDEWKKHFEPFRICRGVTVCPPWHAGTPADRALGEQVVVLEPGRAFGTGLHETTSLVAEILADRAESLRGAGVLDVGCGSGILALVALKLGAARARAIDVDADAVAVTRENAQRNGAVDRLAADQTPLASIPETFRVVVANIEHRTLLELAVPLASRVATGGLLVVSGLLAPDVAPVQLSDVRERYAAEGLIEEETRRKGEWIAAVFRRGQPERDGALERGEHP